MTYFGYLAGFLGIPLLIVGGLTVFDRQRGRRAPTFIGGRAQLVGLAAHVILAVAYTTPWDNYLVATRVWWYDPNLVSGLVLGWVPVEEYTFFVLQTILMGLWLLVLARRLSPASRVSRPSALRWSTSLVGAIIWLSAVVALVVGWRPGTYLALELAWAIPPIILQMGFGADILWRHRRLLAVSILSATLYLAFTDALAISAGTWTIDPAQSLHLLLAGVLPLEEAIFFLLTNTLVGFGMTLILAPQSLDRLPPSLSRRLARLMGMEDAVGL